MEDNVRLAIDASAEELKNHAKTNAPSDEGVLANSIQVSIIEDGFAALVFTNEVYAAAQNFGIPSATHSGLVTVQAHTRTITQAFGRPLASPVVVNVRAHQRQMNIPATLFFTNAIETVRPIHLQRMEEALE